MSSDCLNDHWNNVTKDSAETTKKDQLWEVWYSFRLTLTLGNNLARLTLVAHFYHKRERLMILKKHITSAYNYADVVLILILYFYMSVTNKSYSIGHISRCGLICFSSPSGALDLVLGYNSFLVICLVLILT